MRTIPLKPFGVAIVDDEDFERLVAMGTWSRAVRGKKVYAVCGPRKRKGQKKSYMHRVIMRAKPGQLVDHEDEDGLHNWKSNLRFCAQHENLSNRGLQSNNTTGFKGVQFHRQSGLWAAKIKHKGRVHSLRYHKTPEAAALAYNEAALRLHGAFARLNIIPTTEDTSC